MTVNFVQGFPIVSEAAPPVNPAGHGTGYENRDYAAKPKGKAYSGKIYTKAELLERIREKNANKSWMRDKCDAVGSRVKNQSNSSYCWIHAPVRLMEIANVVAGNAQLTLSAFYAGALIKGGRNQGGSGVYGVEWLIEHGTCREDLHPPMDFSTRNSQEAIANAAKHKVVEAEEFDPDDLMAIYSAVADDIAVTVGIPVWGHEIAITFLADENGSIFPGIDNSWGEDYGTNGRAVLHGRYTDFDEAMAVRAITPSID